MDMTVKLPWTDRRSRSFRSIERPNINLPSVDLANVQVPRPSMPRIDTSGIRTPELSEIRLPNLEIRHIDLPRVDLRSVDLPAIDLPKVDLPHVDMPDIDLGSVGRAVSGAIAGIADALSDTWSDTGDRARETVTSMAANLPADLPLVSRFRPKPRTSMRTRIIAVAAASALAATVASVYIFFVGDQGARRRRALRRRLQGTPAAAQRGIGAAVESARQVGDRAAELVRVPIETARDKVGSRTGDDVSEQTPTEVLAVNAIDVATLEADSDAPLDMTAVAIAAEAAEDGYTDPDAAASIYGEPTIVTDDEVDSSSAFAEAGAGSESQNA